MERATGGLKKIVLDALRQAPREQGPLLAWPVIVGRAIAAQTKALDFTNGVLRVQVPDKNWRTELSAFAPQYIAAYRAIAEVQSIDFVIAGERRAEPPKAV
jgi:Dna[CI] antecedent, DciA